MTRSYTCNRCGKEFTAAREASYCSPKCRTAAHRDRKDPDRQQHRHPLPASVWSRTWATMKASSALLELTHDDRWQRFQGTDEAAMIRGELERAVERLEAVIAAIPHPLHVEQAVTVAEAQEGNLGSFADLLASEDDKPVETEGRGSDEIIDAFVDSETKN